MAQITPGLFNITPMLSPLTQAFTKLGGAPARVGMMDKLMAMNPIQQAEFQRSQAQTPDEFIRADANVRAARQTSGQQSIEAIKAEMIKETDPERMQQLEQAMVDVAKQTGNKAGDYAGSAARLQAARADAQWEARKRQLEVQAASEKNIVTLVSNGMLRSGTTEVPSTIPTPDGDVEITPDLQARIAARVKENQQTIDDLDAFYDGGTLPAAYNNWLNNNQDVIEKNIALKRNVAILQDPNSKASARRAAIKAINPLVEKEQAKQREVSESDDAMNMKVQALIEQIKNSPNETYWFEGADIRDFIVWGEAEESGGATPEERKQFEKFAAQAMRENPNATPDQIIRAAMTGMREKIPAESKRVARAADTAAQQEARAALKKQLAKDNPKYSDAQIEALVEQQLSARKMQRFGQQAQTSRVFQ